MSTAREVFDPLAAGRSTASLRRSRRYPSPRPPLAPPASAPATSQAGPRDAGIARIGGGLPTAPEREGDEDRRRDRVRDRDLDPRIELAEREEGRPAGLRDMERGEDQERTPDRRLALEALEIIDRAVELGFLPPAPAARACDWCDFRSVCGPDEPRHLLRKPAEPLGDLMALREKP
jgi:hypothetical protein